MRLSLSQYNKLEQKMIKKLPAIILEDFTASTFISQNNYMRFENIGELDKFASSLHDNSNIDEKVECLGGIEKNYLTLKYFCKKMILFNKKNFKKRINFITATIDAFISFKALKKIKSNSQLNQLTILDFGSGTGHLSCLLGIAGAKVISYEVTKPFFFFQQKLFDFFFKKNFKVISKSEDKFISGVNLVPSWVLANYKSLVLPKIDVLFINNAINEINPRKLRFLFRLLNKNKSYQLIINGFGVNRYKNFSNLESLGFIKKHEPQKNYENIFVFEKKNSPKYNPIKKKLNIFSKLKISILRLIKIIFFINGSLIKKTIKELKKEPKNKYDKNLIDYLSKDLGFDLKKSETCDYLKFID